MGKQGILLLGLVAIAACDAPSEASSGDPCAAAQTHVDACGVDVQLPDTCDEAGAEAILDADCESLTEPAKADGCNPFFWWTCVGGGGSSDADERTGVAVSVKECGDFFGTVDCSAELSAGSCIEVVVEDRSGNVVGSDLTSVHGSAGIYPLPPGDYVVKVLTRDGDVTPMIDGDPFSSDDTETPAQFEITIEDGDYPVLDVFTKYGTGEAMLQRCADVRAEIEGSCDGSEALTPDETEWSWFFTFDRVDTDAPEQLDISRALVRWVQSIEAQRNFAYGSDLPAGTYEMNVHRMDIPSWHQEPNPDYEDLLERYSEGVVHTERFEVAPDDATTVLDLGRIALDRECD
ncbi:MAG: hypothetical protein AAGA54_04425 [Myxococcota bacterium]